jgi:tRNA 5-methylaminomethyl-2-thiouridine biosynthesis bifunctional protein
MKIAILGAGIAGCTIAGELKNSGHDVYVIDRMGGSAQVTSGHQAALAHPHLTRFPTPLQQLTKLLNRKAFVKWEKQRLHLGAHQIMTDENWVSREAMEQRLLRLGLGKDEAQLLDEAAAYQISGLKRKGVWYPQAGVYDLMKICEESLNGIPQENLIWNKKIQSIEYMKDKWLLRDDQNHILLRSDALVLANNLAVSDLLKTVGVDLELRSVRGQLSRFVISKKSEWHNYLPKVPLTGGGYTTPAVLKDDHYFIQVGSSYDEDNWQLEHWDESDQHNKEQFKILSGKSDLPDRDLQVQKSFVGLRSAARDRMPVIGEVVGQPGLFVATAYGARGVLWSTLAPALIAGYLEAYFAGDAFLRAGFLAGASEAEEASFVSALSPARFLAGAFAGRGSNSKATLPSG